MEELDDETFRAAVFFVQMTFQRFYNGQRHRMGLYTTLLGDHYRPRGREQRVEGGSAATEVIIGSYVLPSALTSAILSRQTEVSLVLG